MSLSQVRDLNDTGLSRRRVRMAWLLTLLPLFASSFHYVPDVGPLYLLSKLWPFLTLPAAVIGYVALKLPARVLYAATLAYLVSIPPFMGMLYFGGSMYEAALTVVKFMPLSFYLSMSLFLAWLRPSAGELRQTITILGWLTFAVMALAWVTVPAGVYSNTWFATTIFLSDDGVRGARIMMPMFFGLMLVFQIGQDIARRFRLIDVARLVLCYALLLTIYKERIPIAFSALIVILAIAARLMGSRLRGVLVLSFLGAGGLAIAVIALGLEAVEDKLGGSLSVRIDTAVLAWNYIADDPLRWIVGVGATTKYSAFTTAMLFRDPFFVLSDIGWLGVLFEVGLIGSLALMAMYVVGLVVTEATVKDDQGVMATLADYAMYIAASSVIYSPTYLPSEIAFVTAMGVYLLRDQGGAAGRAWSVTPFNPRI